MTTRVPIVLRLPSMVLHAGSFMVLLAGPAGLSAERAARACFQFEFKNDEKRFVKELLTRKANFWIFRCDQKRFCGDFVVVDMSSPDPARRRICVLDLKQHAALRVGGGGAGVQFRNAPLAVEAIARAGTVAAGIRFELLSGDRRAILQHLGAL